MMTREFSVPSRAIASLLAVVLAVSLAGCGEERSTVDPRPQAESELEAVLKTVKKANPGFKVTFFAEYTCRDKQPFAAKTQWTLKGTLPGDKVPADRLVKTLVDAGWTEESDSWKDGKKARPNGAYFYYVGLNKGAYLASVKVGEFPVNTAELEVYESQCVDRPPSRQMKENPADPEYVKPTPSPSASE